MQPKPLYAWDEAKRALNRAKHKVDFAAAGEFDWDTAFVYVDDREDYSELREVAIEYIGVRLHVLVFTRRGARIKIISLWKAQKNYVRRYVKGIG